MVFSSWFAAALCKQLLLNLLHEVDDDTIIWLESTVTAAPAE